MKGRPGRQKRGTHCMKGLHEFTPENTRIDKKGGRHCRQCERDYSAIYDMVKKGLKAG